MIKQIAHVHVQNRSDIPLVRRILEATPGVEKVMNDAELDAYYEELGGGRRSTTVTSARGSRGAHNPERSGELVAVSDSTAWFAYYYWNDDAMAPDFARCVAIHRKPGYDPAEMFFRYPGFLGFAWLMFKLLLAYGLKLRTIVDATPLQCDGIRGSHGRLPTLAGDVRPLLAFRKRAQSSAADGSDEEDTEVGAGSDGVLIEGIDLTASGVGGDGGSGGGNELGREGCLSDKRNVIAEDVYEVLWRVLTGEI